MKTQLTVINAHTHRPVAADAALDPKVTYDVLFDACADHDPDKRAPFVMHMERIGLDADTADRLRKALKSDGASLCSMLALEGESSAPSPEPNPPALDDTGVTKADSGEPQENPADTPAA